MARADRSRTITTLTVLVVAMSLGAFVLITMETPPASTPALLRADAADGSGTWADPNRPRTDHSALIRRTDVPVQPIKWRNIILYDTAYNRILAADECHFLIGTPETSGNPGGLIRSTNLWKQQLDGNHVRDSRPPYSNENSIGIRLSCDTSRSVPTAEQMGALTDLVRALQIIFQIPSDRIYLQSGPDTPGRPGRFFPLETFQSRLINVRQ